MKGKPALQHETHGNFFSKIVTFIVLTRLLFFLFFFSFFFFFFCLFARMLESDSTNMRSCFRAPSISSV